jgi:4-carboxymuconolactone decarboxylase
MTMPEDGATDRGARGEEIRREVLGDDYVDAAQKRGTEFMEPFQELVTEYCWGEIWGRPGLDRRTRSLLNIAMLSALNRESELRLHVGGAVANGCTREEIQETLLQVSVYCGVPAGLSSFKVANEVLEEDG